MALLDDARFAALKAYKLTLDTGADRETALGVALAARQTAGILSHCHRVGVAVLAGQVFGRGAAAYGAGRNYPLSQTGKGAHSRPISIQDGCCSVAPRWPQRVHRALCLSMSLEASAPRRMMSGA